MNLACIVPYRRIGRFAQVLQIDGGQTSTNTLITNESGPRVCDPVRFRGWRPRWPGLLLSPAISRFERCAIDSMYSRTRAPPLVSISCEDGEVALERVSGARDGHTGKGFQPKGYHMFICSSWCWAKIPPRVAHSYRTSFATAHPSLQHAALGRPCGSGGSEESHREARTRRRGGTPVLPPIDCQIKSLSLTVSG